MLVMVSPAKRLDWTPRDVAMTRPRFEDRAAELAAIARDLAAADLRRLMDISADLARLTARRFAEYEDAPEGERPAALAFAGDTYAGLEAASLDAEEWAYADRHLRILSGLYGLLRPADAIRPYRLEMGSKLATPRGRDLYAHWGTDIATALRADAGAAGTEVLVNCASQEYARAVDRRALGLRVVTPTFLEAHPSGPRMVSFHAKKARGALARFIVQARLRDPADLVAFDAAGYRHQPDRSTPDAPVFVRSQAAAA